MSPSILILIGRSPAILIFVKIKRLLLILVGMLLKILISFEMLLRSVFKFLFKHELYICFYYRSCLSHRTSHLNKQKYSHKNLPSNFYSTQ